MRYFYAGFEPKISTLLNGCLPWNDISFLDVLTNSMFSLKFHRFNVCRRKSGRKISLLFDLAEVNFLLWFHVHFHLTFFCQISPFLPLHSLKKEFLFKFLFHFYVHEKKNVYFLWPFRSYIHTCIYIWNMYFEQNICTHEYLYYVT